MNNNLWEYPKIQCPDNCRYDMYTHKEERLKKGLISIEELKDEWIEYKRLHGISETTILKYESDWRCHLEGTAIVRKPISQLKKHDLDDWAHKLIRDNNMTRTDYINVSTLIRQKRYGIATLF